MKTAAKITVMDGVAVRGYMEANGFAFDAHAMTHHQNKVNGRIYFDIEEIRSQMNERDFRQMECVVTQSMTDFSNFHSW